MADTTDQDQDDNDKIEREPTGRSYVVYIGQRLAIPENIECRAEIETKNGQRGTFRVRDVSAFGIRVYAHTNEIILKLNESIEIILYFYDQIVFEATATVANETEGNGLISYGLSLGSSFLDIENIRALISNSGSRASLQVSTSLVPLLEKVRPEFKALVADLNSIFREIQDRLETEEIRINEIALNGVHKEKMSENALALAVSLNIQSILEVFNKFQQIVSQFGGEENSLHKKYFRLNFGELIWRTPFLRRAFEKPLGYPGDYGLMVMFYQYRDLGETIFDKFMHRLACNQPVAVANQNRVEYLAALMENKVYLKKDKRFKITSIACGPAFEIYLFLQRASLNKDQQIKTIIVDQESRALDYAIEQLKKTGSEVCDFSLTAVKEDAVLGLIKKRPFVDELNSSDMIICAGLFDYLSDRVATKLIETMLERLVPGGSLIVGNVSTEHPNKFSMEYFMEWNLVLRSPVQLLSLVPEKYRNRNGFSATVVSESLGINLFLEIRRAD